MCFPVPDRKCRTTEFEPNHTDGGCGVGDDEVARRVLEVTWSWKLPGSYLEVLEETMALRGAVLALIPTRTSLEAHEVPVPASSTPPGLVSLTPQGPQGYG